MTATSLRSRNRTLGEMLGSGKSLGGIPAGDGMVARGFELQDVPEQVREDGASNSIPDHTRMLRWGYRKSRMQSGNGWGIRSKVAYGTTRTADPPLSISGKLASERDVKTCNVHAFPQAGAR
ncbi:MAG: hypothetical protein CM15mP6_4300 [Methanobacteriota archaeon]|nr:MAG: hypothetical protein CM15mP6_4300 [Euryarchaeota archaeon]